MNKKESCVELSNDECKTEIRLIQKNMLNRINDNYLLQYWLAYLKEKERMYLEDN